MSGLFPALGRPLEIYFRLMSLQFSSQAVERKAQLFFCSEVLVPNPRLGTYEKMGRDEMSQFALLGNHLGVITQLLRVT